MNHTFPKEDIIMKLSRDGENFDSLDGMDFRNSGLRKKAPESE